MESSVKASPWARLDNAGKIYPSLVSSRNTTLFRLSARLDKPIHCQIMQDSIDALTARFPYYHVHLQRGAFWYYFTASEHRLLLERDSRYPCMKMPIRQRTRIPFRVRAFKNQVAVEFSHILTDGTGAMHYFQALLAEYLKRKENIQGPFPSIMEVEDEINPEESEDAFQRFYQRRLPQPAKESRAFKLQDPLEPKGIYHVITGRLNTGELLKASKAVGLSMTGYLTAILLEVFQDYLEELLKAKQKATKAPIRVCIPINLRRFFPSKTMRNFFLSLNPGIDPRLGHYSFEEICQQVRHFMASHLNEKELSQQISRNIKGERRISVRLIPSWIKDLIIPRLYRNFGESTYSTVLSNLGRIDLPPQMMKHIEYIDFVPNPPEGTTRVKLGVASLGESTSITFGRLSKDPEIERRFFRKLRHNGLAIWIESNDWDPPGQEE